MTDMENGLRECRSKLALSIEVLEAEMGITPALPITLPLLSACREIDRAVRVIVRRAAKVAPQ